MNRYRFCGTILHEVECSSDDIAKACARYVTGNEAVRVLRHNGRYWVAV